MPPKEVFHLSGVDLVKVITSSPEVDAKSTTRVQNGRFLAGRAPKYTATDLVGMKDLETKSPN